MRSTFRKSLEERIAGLVKPVISEANYDLIELQLVQRRSGSLLRLLVDRAGGITLDECAELSRRVAYVLEIEDPIESRYTLEVSSPGLDRPLTTEADFRRKTGEVIRLMLKEGDQRRQVDGEIVEVTGDHLVLKTEQGELKFRLRDVIKGKILY